MMAEPADMPEPSPVLEPPSDLTEEVSEKIIVLPLTFLITF
eukprot:SAG11_NODE_5456_length_1554_cov_2.196564_2_plen_41_part_00